MKISKSNRKLIEYLLHFRLPYTIKALFFSFGVCLIFVVFLIIFNFINIVGTDLWLSYILTVQTFILILNFWYIYTHIKYERLPYCPEFEIRLSSGVYTAVKKKENTFLIELVNTGTDVHAHNVKYDILAKKFKKYRIVDNNFSMIKINETKIISKEIPQKYLKENKIQIFVYYEDRILKTHLAKWVKLKGELDFFKITQF